MFLLLAHAVILVGATAAQGEQAGGGVPPGPDPSGAPPLQEASDELDLAAQRGRIESLYQGALVGAVDAQDFAETPGYRQLLEILSRYGEDELRAKAVRRLDWSQALADPDSWRGEIVRVRALVVNWRAVRLSRPLGEHVDAYRAFLAEADGSEGVVVDFLEAPPDLEKKDVVDLEAVFFRTVRYESSGQGFFEAPYLIARNLRRMDPDTLPRSTAFDDFAKILIGLAVACLVIRIVFTMRKNPVVRRRLDAGDPLASRALRERARAALQPEPPAPKS